MNARVRRSRPHGKSSREREVLLPYDRQSSQASLLHPHAHAGQGDQAGQCNRCKGGAKAYQWTDSVPKDDPEFQGLLKNEDEAPFPDVSAELPGVVLESEERDFTPITDEPEEDFWDLARAALHNAGIDPDQRIRVALDAGTGPNTPAVIEAEPDEVESV